MARTNKTIAIGYVLPTDRPETKSMAVPFDPCSWPTELTLAFPEDSGVELPESGTITLRYKLRRSSEDHANEKCTYDLTLTEVIGATSEPEVERAESAEDALDKRFAK